MGAKVTSVRVKQCTLRTQCYHAVERYAFRLRCIARRYSDSCDLEFSGAINLRIFSTTAITTGIWLELLVPDSCCATASVTRLRFNLPVLDCCTATSITAGPRFNLPILVYCTTTAITAGPRFDFLILDYCTTTAITAKPRFDLPVWGRCSDNRDQFLRFLPDTLELRLLSRETSRLRRLRICSIRDRRAGARCRNTQQR